MIINSSPEPDFSAEDLQRTYIPHLKSQFELARPILFTGAGFSLAARNLSGKTLPTYDEIQRRLWDLCFPGEAFEDGSTLQYLFEHAALRHRVGLTELLTDLLSVDGESLPRWYQEIFSLPWFRCYTLNIDDLALATNRAFTLPRLLRQVSATNPNTPTPGSDSSECLEVVHLNGTLDDLPDNVTFSLTQFAERLSRTDSWYTRFATELLSHPVVIIGTRLDEPPLWQHLTYRGGKGGRQLGELRPRSYLVTPQLDRARKALLAQFNISWVNRTAEQFTTDVLSQLEDAKIRGLHTLKTRRDRGAGPLHIQAVADLAVNPSEESEFLLGHEPIWADVQSGRAIRRDSDDQLWAGIVSALSRGSSGLIVVSGTAGSGKSTALMTACLRLVAQGEHVGWIDRDSGLSFREIRRSLGAEGAPRVVAIDDADMYGPSLASFVCEMLGAHEDLLLLVALRSVRVDGCLNPTIIQNVERQEFAMPPLTDGDIDGLLAVLDENNRLGVLNGFSPKEQRQVLRQKCGRQLLIAMIEATSGRRFEEKAIQELTDLERPSATIYAIIAVAHAFRFPLQRDEILMASRDLSNEALNIVQRLVDRHVVASSNKGLILARHRVIAEILRTELEKQGQIGSVLSGLAFMAASKVNRDMPRSSRPWRMLQQLINHDRLLRTVDREQTRNFYGQLEPLLFWDFHYWLQRGSLEVEAGDLNMARHFLSQARSIEPEDAFVENEWAYLLFREAIATPGATDAAKWVTEATNILEDLIDGRTQLDPHPYHVLGSQGLAWSRRGIANSQKKAQYLEKLRGIVQAGLKKHPAAKELKQLHEDIQQEYLGIAVN